VHGTASLLTNRFLSVTEIQTLVFGRRRYGLFFLAIVGFLFTFIMKKYTRQSTGSASFRVCKKSCRSASADWHVRIPHVSASHCNQWMLREYSVSSIQKQ